MASALPKTKFDEVWGLVTHYGLKDLRLFGGGASERLALRRSLSQLLEKSQNMDERIDAHMSLGMLANYENKHVDALQHFESAYVLAPLSVAVTSNYARALGTAGQPERAAQKFFEALVLSPSDGGVFMPLLRVCVDYLYVDILDAAISLSAKAGLSRQMMDIAVARAIQVEELLNFLARCDISLEVYRSVFQCAEFLIYGTVSISTPVQNSPFVNADTDCYSNMIRVGYLNPVQVVELNDALEDCVLNWIDENKADYANGALKRMVGHLVFYCMPMNDIEVAHAG